MNHPIVTDVSRCALLASLCTLLSCASPNSDPQQRIDLPPPELLAPPQTESASESPISTENPSAQPSVQSESAPPETVSAPAKARAVLPGLARRQTAQPADDQPGSVNARQGDLPFETSLREHEKRVYLGLDREQESQPVNNILDWEF